MDIVVNWLNQNSGAVQAAAIIVLVLVTSFYAWQTQRQAKASEKQLEALAEQLKETVEQTRAARKLAQETGYQVQWMAKQAKASEYSAATLKPLLEEIIKLLERMKRQT